MYIMNTFKQTRLIWLIGQRPDKYEIGTSGITINRTHFAFNSFNTETTLPFQNMNVTIGWSFIGNIMWLFGKGFGPVYISSDGDKYALNAVRGHRKLAKLLSQRIINNKPNI